MALRLHHSQHTGRFQLLLILAVLLVLPVASAVTLAGAPQTKISRRETIKRVDRYVTALEDKNFAVWNELLSPMHPGSPQLKRSIFLEQASLVQSLSVEQIDGLNAALKIEYNDAQEIIGSLQIHASGPIKYTPFVFKHPVSRACSLVKILLYDYTTLLGTTSNEARRRETIWKLDALGIPLCDYDPLAPSPYARRAAAEKIFLWVEENGQTFDNTEPKVFIAPDEFTRCIEDARPSAY